MNELIVMTAPVHPSLVPAVCRVWEVSREGKKLVIRVDSARAVGFRLHHGDTDREVAAHNGVCDGMEFTIKLKGDEAEDVWFTAHPFEELEHQAVGEKEAAAKAEVTVEETVDETPKVAAKPETSETATEVPVAPKRPRFVTLGGEGLKVR